jgi:hypothetical protein
VAVEEEDGGVNEEEAGEPKEAAESWDCAPLDRQPHHDI